MNPRRVALAATCLFFAQVVISLVRPLTAYRVLALGEPAAVVGWLSAAYALVPVLLAIRAGRWAAGRGLGRLAVGGSILVLAGCLWLANARGIGDLVGGSILLGTGNLGQMIAYQSVVAAESDDAHYSHDYGWYSVGASLGQLVGPVLGTWFYARLGAGVPGSTGAILLGAFVAMLGVAASGAVIRGVQTAAPLPSGEQPAPTRILRRPGVKASMYVSLVGMATIELLSVYLPVLGEERGLTPTFVGLLLAVRAVVSLLSRVTLDWVLGRFSGWVVLLTTVVAAATAVLVVPAVRAPWLLVAVMSVLGFALGTGQPISLAWSVAVVLPPERPTTIALRLMGNRVGQVVVPAVAATTVAATGAASVFVLMGVMLATSAGALALSGGTAP